MRFIKRLLALLIIIITIPVAAITALCLALTVGLSALVVLLGLSAVDKTKLNTTLEDLINKLQETKEGE